MWDAVQEGYYDFDIQTYYKQEAIIGLEWQFRPDWRWMSSTSTGSCRT